MKRKWRPRLIKIAVALAVALLLTLSAPLLVNLYHLSRAQPGADGKISPESIPHLEWLFERSPADMDLCLNLTDAYMTADNSARAEYTIVRGLKSNADKVPLYLKMCEIYLSQDKVADAVAFLDSISNPLIKEQIDDLRPRPPVLSPAPGRYEEIVSLSLSNLDGDTDGYLSISGQSPSVKSDRFSDAYPLPVGVTHVKAIAIRGSLPSTWAEGEYRLENIVLPMTFADAALERIIREQLDNPDGDILSSDLWDITRLVADTEPAHYTSFDDLAHMQGLVELSLYGDGSKVDIACLAELSNLKTLSLRQFALGDSELSMLSSLTKLTTLALADNRISVISPVSGMTWLSTLDLSGNSIKDLAPLSDLISITRLDLSGNTIEDTSKLATMSALKELLISENEIKNLRGLITLTRLNVLDISYNDIGDLQALTGLVGLKELYCKGCPVWSLEPLRDITGLEVLYCTSGGVRSVEPLSSMGALRVLALDDNELATLEGLENCVSLEYLQVNRNQLVSLGALAGLPKLFEVSVEFNQLTSISSLGDCPSLIDVFVYGNPLAEGEDHGLGENVTVHGS